MPRVRDLSARRKLMLAFALAAMASVAVGVGALRALAQVRARADVARRDEAVNDARDAALIGMQQTSIAIRDDLLAEDAAQQAAAKVASGTELVHRSGATLDEIVSSVNRVGELVGELASATREESAGVEQINQSIAQMDQVTQANAASTEEMSATAQALSGQAEHLRGTVAAFRIDEDVLTRAMTLGSSVPRRARRMVEVGDVGSTRP